MIPSIYFFYYTLIYIAILFFVILISKKLNFYDQPNGRKIHKKKILNTSGISLYLFLIFIICTNEFSYDLELIISLGLIIVICGFFDDRVLLKTSSKLILILIPVIYLILNNYKLESLGEYEKIGNLYLGKFSFVFTLLAAGLLINSYNYIDGVDGLLITNIISGLIYIIFLLDNNNIKNLLLIMIIPLIINLIFNFFPKKNSFKIFLGDGGSLFLGYFISFLMIYLYKYKNIHPAYLIWITWYPVSDFLFVTFFRILKKKSFYSADNLHFHHKLYKKFNNSHIKTTLVISLINFLLIFSGYCTSEYLGKIHSLGLFILTIVTFFFIRLYFENQKSRGGAVW